MSESRLPTEDGRLLQALERDLAETGRVTKLTNEQLVSEILNKLPFTELDILIEEACTRLDPDWANRDLGKPLTPEQEERLARLTADAMRRCTDITDREKHG